MVDSIRLLRTALTNLEATSGSRFKTKSLNCDLDADIWPMGLALRNEIHNVSVTFYHTLMCLSHESIINQFDLTLGFYQTTPKLQTEESK